MTIAHEWIFLITHSQFNPFIIFTSILSTLCQILPEERSFSFVARSIKKKKSIPSKININLNFTWYKKNIIYMIGY
jgi:hypothetical protein